jgi:ribosomal-protein-alanine N-acetyltransferase
MDRAISTYGSAAPMGFFIRPMRMEDIPQTSAVERACFPAGWIATPFKRELKNRSAVYLVACEAANPKNALTEAHAFDTAPPEDPPKAGLQRLVEGMKGVFSQPEPPPEVQWQHIVGFVGVWFMVDEAHITVIGVRDEYRRHGVGELLLLAATEASFQREAAVMTLEVRISNQAAQGLYTKYGYHKAGVRKGYYTDNKEDALIMTTEAIGSPAYRALHARLAQEHAARWGASVRHIG